MLEKFMPKRRPGAEIIRNKNSSTSTEQRLALSRPARRIAHEGVVTGGAWLVMVTVGIIILQSSDVRLGGKSSFNMSIEIGIIE